MRRKRIPEWAEPRQEVERLEMVRSFDPVPQDAPERPRAVLQLAKALEAGGWEVRIGYSRAWKRAQRTGTYRPIETFGIHTAANHPSGYRVLAIYWRFLDTGAERSYFSDSKEFEYTAKASGEPGTWAWLSCRIIRGINRHRCNATDVKEFAKVRGSVTPAWFSAIEERLLAQAAKQLCGKPELHEGHSWAASTGSVYVCSGKAAKVKETVGA
jgi:hypothetical protein